MKITKTISDVAYTADDWELYTYEPEHAARSAACAQRLNNKFMELVNAGGTREGVEQAMERFMGQHENSQQGAADSEGFRMLARLLKKVFGE